MNWVDLQHLPGLRLPWDQTDWYLDRLDPYLAWGDAAATLRFSGEPGSPKSLPMTIQLSIDLREEPRSNRAALNFGLLLFGLFEALNKQGIKITQAYWPSAPGNKEDRGDSEPECSGFPWSRTVTALVRIDQVLSLKGQATFDVLIFGVRWRAVLTLRAVLGQPRVPKNGVATYSEIIPEDLQLKGTVVAVIDDGCPFAHSAYVTRNNGKWRSRVRWLWDQNPEPGPSGPWNEPANFAYGRELKGAMLDEHINHSDRLHSDGGIDEDRCYFDADYRAVAWRSVSHGAQVLHLAAGNPVPLVDITGESSTDSAAESEIIFVQLPAQTVADTSGGSLANQAVDALHYVLQRTHKDAKLVVCFGFGAHAGPHDGRGVLESAIDEILSRHRCGRMAIVLPSGNTYGTSTHARVEVGGGATEAVTWIVPPASRADAFAEIWIPDDEAGESQPLSVRLVPPGSDPTKAPFVELGRAQFLRPSLTGAPLAGVINALHAANGRSGSMVLLFVGPTEPGGVDRPVAAPGRWGIELRNVSGRPVVAQLWAERNSPLFGSGGRQGSFENCLDSSHSLSSVANGDLSLVVGGYVKTTVRSDVASSYTAAGPSRSPSLRVGPDFSAPCEASDARPYLLASGCRSGSSFQFNGTSAAAPLVARQLLAALKNAATPPKDAREVKKLLDYQSVIDPDIARLGSKLRVD